MPGLTKTFLTVVLSATLSACSTGTNPSELRQSGESHRLLPPPSAPPHVRVVSTGGRSAALLVQAHWDGRASVSDRARNIDWSEVPKAKGGFLAIEMPPGTPPQLLEVWAYEKTSKAGIPQGAGTLLVACEDLPVGPQCDVTQGRWGIRVQPKIPNDTDAMFAVIFARWIVTGSTDEHVDATWVSHLQ